MTVLDFVEELRFILELLIAEQIFAWNFVGKNKVFRAKDWAGMVGMTAIALLYPMLRENFSEGFSVSTFSLSWYIMLVMLSLLFMKNCYEMTWSDTFFMVIAGYSVQHIDYVLVNEIFAKGIYPKIALHIFAYVMICTLVTAVFYFGIFKLFAFNLRSCEGRIYEDKPLNVIFLGSMLIVLLTSSFMCQSLFMAGTVDASKVNYLGAVSDLFNCMLILLVQLNMFHIHTLNKEKEIVKQLLYERQKQYALSKENIEIINHKCHDLKHQIAALKYVKSDELEEYINEVKDSVMIYDTVVKTDNEVLNTILSEKNLYCESHQIQLSCIVDSGHMDFMSTLDVYALLGNALDNAIECVSRCKDKEKRVISLTISSKWDFLCIQTNNYVEGSVEMKDGLPVTTKTRKGYHGFGMRSMKHIAEKYGGTMYTDIEDGVFTLQVILPMPPEFLRLLRKENNG